MSMTKIDMYIKPTNVTTYSVARMSV